MVCGLLLYINSHLLYKNATCRVIPPPLHLSQVKAGPRDGDDWIKRMKEEYTALIAYQKFNKEAGNEWFTIESNKTGTRWTGKVWTYHEQLRYEFDLEFDLPVRGYQFGILV